MKCFALPLGLAALLILILPLTSIAAETNVVRGKVGEQSRLPIYSDKDLDEALKISDECKANSDAAMRYDCDCLGMNFLEQRRKQGEKAQRFWLYDAAKRKCPNTPAMAGKVYSQCVQWAPMQRGEDYEEFCACYSSSYAKLYGKNPTDNLLVVEAQMTKAMAGCKVNAVNERIQDSNAFVKKLKENGTYEKLFPGAEPERVPPKPPVSNNPQ